MDTDYVKAAGGRDKTLRLRVVNKTKAHNAKIGYNFHPILAKYSFIDVEKIRHDANSVYKPLAEKFEWITKDLFTWNRDSEQIQTSVARAPKIKGPLNEHFMGDGRSGDGMA